MFDRCRTQSELYRDLTVRTVVIPSGDKPSCVGDAPLDYAKDTSPDKVRSNPRVGDLDSIDVLY